MRNIYTNCTTELYEQDGAVVIAYVWIDVLFNSDIGRPLLALGPDANGLVGYAVPYPTQGQPIYLGQVPLEEDDGAEEEKPTRNGLSNRSAPLIKSYNPTITGKVPRSGVAAVRRLFASGNGATIKAPHTMLIVYDDLLDSPIGKLWHYRFYWNTNLKAAKRVSDGQPQVIDMLASANAGYLSSGCPRPAGERYWLDFYTDTNLNPTDDEGNLL